MKKLSVEVFEFIDLLPAIVASKNKWAIYINSGNFLILDNFMDKLRSSNLIKKWDLVNMSFMDCLVVFFESESDADKIYSILNNKPFYSSALFAIKFDPKGKAVSENT